ncbi:hypothetical protein EDD16DRAFT_1241764 [Pisolithus croceorrhizus]|nr:hypothetical protein EDD16DRAFT_1241764 [Pisolithus croceorrhizus]
MYYPSSVVVPASYLLLQVAMSFGKPPASVTVRGLGKSGYRGFNAALAAYSPRNGLLSTTAPDQLFRPLVSSSLELRASCECVREDSSSRK